VRAHAAPGAPPPAQLRTPRRRNARTCALSPLATLTPAPQAGVNVLLLEASDGVGGRVRTDEVEARGHCARMIRCCVL
jgi:hypothetical protein